MTVHTDLSLKEMQKEWHGTLKSYVIGFILSLLLTALSFYLVIAKPLSREALIYTLMGLAFLQATIQLIFFLHIGHESKPRWGIIALACTIVVALILVIGSIWIMHDLDQRMMPHMNREKHHD